MSAQLVSAVVVVLLGLTFLLRSVPGTPQTSRPHPPAQQPGLTGSAAVDLLTGLASRQLLVRRADSLLARAAVDSPAVAVVVLELADWPATSRALGQDRSRQLLATVTRRLRSGRPLHDVVARLDEARFAVLVEGNRADAVSGIARRCRHLLEEPVTVGTQQLSLSTVSALAVPGAGQRDGAGLVRAAERALAAQLGAVPESAVAPAPVPTFSMPTAPLPTAPLPTAPLLTVRPLLPQGA